MPSEYQTTRRVEWADTDTAGIIHFSRYFCFMEQVEHEFLRSVGLSCIMERDGERITWPRVSATCDFVQPLRFEDVVDVRLRVKRRGEKSITFSFLFTRNGVEIARGQVVTVCCLLEHERLVAIPIPAFVRDQIDEQTDEH